MADIEFAFVLNLHQPSGNLEHLLDAARQAGQGDPLGDRRPAFTLALRGPGTGSLAVRDPAETLANPDFQRRVSELLTVGHCCGICRTPDHRAPRHRLLPSRAPADPSGRPRRAAPPMADDRRGYLLARDRFPGFWPPELGFSRTWFPPFVHGYHYVIVDSEHVAPLTPMRWEELRYRPHLAEFGEQIVVVVRDRELSDAQESAIDTDWFSSRSQGPHAVLRLPATCHDRNPRREWRLVSEHRAQPQLLGSFHAGLMERARAEPSGGIRPTFISDYLDRYGPHGWVTVGREREHRHRVRSMDRLPGQAAGAHPRRGAQRSGPRRPPQRDRDRRRQPRPIPPPRGRPHTRPAGRDELQLLLGGRLGATLPRRPRPSHPAPRTSRDTIPLTTPLGAQSDAHDHDRTALGLMESLAFCERTDVWSVLGQRRAVGMSLSVGAWPSVELL